MKKCFLVLFSVLLLCSTLVPCFASSLSEPTYAIYEDRFIFNSSTYYFPESSLLSGLTPYFIFDKGSTVYAVFVSPDIDPNSVNVNFNSEYYFYFDASRILLCRYTEDDSGILSYTGVVDVGSMLYVSGVNTAAEFRSFFVVSRFDVFWSPSLGYADDIFFPATPEIFPDVPVSVPLGVLSFTDVLLVCILIMSVLSFVVRGS